jgi:hypothetical protein
MKPTKRIITTSVLIIAGGLLFTAGVRAQSSQMLIPYGMSAGMSVLNRAFQPRPAAAPTPPRLRIRTAPRPVIGGSCASSGPASAG